MGCCCSSTANSASGIELSHQEQQEVQAQRNAKRRRQGLPELPLALDATIDCCCCSVPAIQLSFQEEQEINARRNGRPQQQAPPLAQRSQAPTVPQQPPVPQAPAAPFQQRPKSTRSVASDISDLPPPYEEGVAASASGTVSEGQSASLPATRLPYSIPLASFMNDEALLNTISKVHTANFSNYGITQEQFLTFYYELDKRLAHQPDGGSAMLDNVMTILRDNNSHAPSTAGSDALSRVENFLELSNNDLFHPARLNVEVLGNEDTKHKYISSPAQELDRSKTMTKLAKIEERLAKLTHKYTQELPEASDEEERDELQADYDKKKKKLRAKANAVLAEYGRRTDAEMLGPYGAAGQEGPLWLVVSERRLA